MAKFEAEQTIAHGVHELKIVSAFEYDGIQFYNVAGGGHPYTVSEGDLYAYKVKREFKVGDVVKMTHDSFFVVGKDGLAHRFGTNSHFPTGEQSGGTIDMYLMKYPEAKVVNHINL